MTVNVWRYEKLMIAGDLASLIFNSYLAAKGGSSRKTARAKRYTPKTTVAGRVADVSGWHFVI
jgi:hypothetical protein